MPNFALATGHGGGQARSGLSDFILIHTAPSQVLTAVHRPEPREDVPRSHRQMANTMLVDAAHPEETRVVVVRGNRVEEFDFEAANRKQLRGNIYLAKVTRVEPSLQAAFVDYGGNRHGFLAFSEIHPDYYQIPVADRLALLEEEEASVQDEDSGEAATDAAAENDAGEADEADEDAKEAESEADADADGDGDDDQVESVGVEDALEEVPERGPRVRRQYKIQEVIRRRQVLLVQVVKEERGNKGAALTTYLSLAGRYSVLMPNTARGGGISRKITNPTDRKRLKKVAAELTVPEGMGVILRTAGASRTKAEIKRDFEYLLRLWENVRDLTLQSSAPSLVYEEGSLIKRSIRDLYNKDIDAVLVSGDDGYREAKDFMRMLMPSHAKNVQPYKEATPIFNRYGVESQLDLMFSPQVTLPSGGYIVINQTEALVSIDVNSGRATREHNIEDTALATNLEAAAEVAHQLRLRDLAGLIVIDFIDMEEKRNNRSVERKLKECLKSDRARIQVGRISHFGLLEMSRQRIRTGVLESSTEVCPHCQGSGTVRSTESVALHVLRSLEDHLLRGVKHHVRIATRTAVALYILNQKRPHLTELEQRFGLTVTVSADEMVNGEHYTLERGDPIERSEPLVQVVSPDHVRPDEIDEDEAEPAEEEKSSRRRRRRRRRKPGTEVEAAETSATVEEIGEEADEAEDAGAEAGADGAEDDSKRRRRRGRRGGRRSKRARSDAETTAEGEAQDGAEDGGDDAIDEAVSAEPAEAFDADGDVVTSDADDEHAETAAAAEDADAGSQETAAAADEVETESDIEMDAEAEPVVAEIIEEPTDAEEAVMAEETSDEDVDASVASEPEAPAEAAPETQVIEAAGDAGEEVKNGAGEAETGSQESEQEEPSGPKKSGWWQRGSFF